MKIADYISRSIQEHPILYKDVDYERSKLKVLDHVFFVIGNGLEMAKTDNPKEGGYVVTPKYKKDKNTGDWVRVEDKPYGKERYKPIPDGYFEGLAANNRPFAPYPFSKGYSIVCDVFYNDAFLQEDWLRELIFLCRRTLGFFSHKEEYKLDAQFPTESKIKYDLMIFEGKLKAGGVQGLNKLQELWGYEIKEAIPTYDEVKAMKNNKWESFHKDKIDFLTSFLSRFSGAIQ